MKKAKQKPPLTFPPFPKAINFLLTFFLGLGMALCFAWLISLTSTSPCPPDISEGQEKVKCITKTINITGLLKNFSYDVSPLYLSLILAGALGGLLYSILLDGELELPSWSKKNPNNLNPGFLGEIFVGIGGAFIAYKFLPQELRNLGDPGLEITIFVTGLVGGYGGKAILDAALKKVINRIDTANEAKEIAESQAKELEEKTYIRNLVNQQIQEGLNQSELSEMQEKLESATDDVKERAFNLAHDARSLGRRTLTFKDRVNRTIPIFEALVASDNNNASYNAELGYAYISSQPPDLDKAISYLDRAIELRIPGASTEGDSWKYEMNRAIARIGLGNSQSRDDILKDLFAVEQRKGLAQAIDEYERDGVDGGNNSIKNWLIQNQDWVSQQTNGKALLDKIQLSAVAKPVTSTLSVTQNRADLVAAPPNTKIKATIKTYLKKQPIDSSQLGENEKKEVPVGTEYKILKHSQESDGHCLVELDYGQGIWYIWSDHWYLPWEHKILSSVPQSSKNGSAREAIDQLSRISAISLTNRGTLKAAATRSIQRSATTTKVEPENWVIAPPNTIIKATTKTYLKKQPIDSSDLGENEKKEVPVGREYKVLKYSEEIDGHCLVELDYGAGTWYLWSDHWHLPWQQSSRNNSLSSVSAPESSQHQGVNLVTRQQAESVYGRKMSDKQFNDLNSCLQRFEINTVPRIRHFLSQTAHESAGLQYMTEIWGPSQVAAQRTYDPPYPKAKELGNTKIGEGKKYRGAGVIQLTGKYNYQAFSRFINDPKVMDGADYVGANYPFTSAGFWWKNNNMNALCDRGATCRQISARVNGRDPANHLQKRQRYYDKACQVIKQLSSTSLHTEELAAKPETVKAATSTTTAQSFGSLDLGNDLASRIIKYMKTKGYQVFTNPREYNIVYVEGMNPNGTLNDDRPNEFNDLRMVIEFKNGKPEIVGSWEATTEPGDKYTYSPQNPNGAARIKFGQYQAWIKAWHPMPKSSKSHEALFQTQPIEVYRDSNKDFRRDGDRIQKGIFGINQHWGYDLPKNAISGASAGCLVGRTKQGHKEFMAIIKQDKRYLSDPNYVFYTTVIPGDDLEDV
ncbi:MAG: hypothetical protein O9332_04655 [Microcystis sp. LE19-10.1B]|uniref:hypothetical protein n=1 Tax=Microcystis sp. LE19-10.1B TaxID=3016428 RepID=UPI0022C176F1|nr:hypothetical protein [Microcystis sp. LE19-10.1B]MCZ8024759.1 hypothetical protein [Microcystis sp. LE19-10.1B]MCZ8361759.1 hypothetical protein [Microcystis sp. LE19-251.1A]